ncbi:MAG: Si-specific NAD(P)(+) transhydrogenase [Gammaproteobacteria bacterium]|nr:Si-specific NAD(P)(+) transhydrogenase [Gammaproteobacteria bacterium]
MTKYDFVVIGSGPAGQRAAIQAAKLGRTVALIERSFSIGGACVHTGTIPSKTLREAVLYLSGWRQRGFYGRSYRVKERITAEDLMQRLDITIRHEIEILMHKLHRNFVDTIAGNAVFESPHVLRIETGSDEVKLIEADKILIATGSRPVQPPGIPFDCPNVVDSDNILDMQELPRTVVVVGAGVIGVEYAAMLSALDIGVTLVDGRTDILGFLDREIVDEFTHHLRDRGVSLRLGETVQSVEVIDDKKLVVHLASGKHIRANMALFASGRVSNTDKLRLENAGLTPDSRGRLEVDANFATAVPHIYAAGDVIGFPALASTSMEQGRQAAAHAFNGVVKATNDIFPFGIYAVPEMSVVGKTEEELRSAGVAYETGIARFRETSRGQILGLREGLLKLLVSLEDRRLLGVHIVGEGATELIHIGQAVLAHDGKLDFFVEAVFNYPTLAEAYKIAALDAWNKL